MENIYALLRSKLAGTINDDDKFFILKHTGLLLSNQTSNSLGRDIVIRILDRKNEFLKYEELVKRVIRKSGLFPYLVTEFKNLSLEESLTTDLYRPAGLEEEFVFHSLQQLVYKTLIGGDNVVLSASTSSGKSAVVDSILACNKFNTVVIIVPTIALIDETRKRISARFKDFYQIISHPSQVKHQSKAVYILTQERVNSREDLNDIDLFVLDEFYKLEIKEQHDYRAIELNISLSKLINVSKQFYLIGPNITEVLGLNHFNKKYVFIPDDFSTVALNVQELNLNTNDNSRLDKTIEILNNYNGPTMIYCQSPKSVSKLLNELVASDIKFTASVNEDFIHWLSKNYHPDWVVVKALQNGIGIHHGALPRSLQQKMIKLFNDRSINVLICTSTIIEGVNSCAKNVIIYDRRDGTNVVSHFTHKNIQGRAGRMTRYFIGNVFCLEAIPESDNKHTKVNIESGLQSEEVPLNLLYGISDEHLKEQSKKRLNEFYQSTTLPELIFKSNVKYSPYLIQEVYNHVTTLPDIDIYCWTGMPPSSHAFKVLCELIYLLEKISIDRCNLSNVDSLNSILLQYLNAKSYSDFIISKMNYYEGADDISDTMDWLLKVVRNLLCYNVPKALSTISDIIQFEIGRRNLPFELNYGFIINRMENYHLPSSLAAVDEFGIPIQVAEKFSADSFIDKDVDFVLDHIKTNYKSMEVISNIEKQFIEETLF